MLKGPLTPEEMVALENELIERRLSFAQMLHDILHHRTVEEILEGVNER